MPQKMENLEKVLNNPGIELSDLGDGVTSDTLKEYFNDIAKSAIEASNAIEKTNNDLTMNDIKTAFESKNAGDDYVSLNDYLKKAKELYDQGLVGTDDFKSVAEAISYHPDPSGDKKNLLGKKLEGWESQLSTWENDLATLDTDVVMNIKLEYDLATIQSQIDEVQELIDGGADTVDNNAQVIVGNQKYINTAREGLGLNQEGIM